MPIVLVMLIWMISHRIWVGEDKMQEYLDDIDISCEMDVFEIILVCKCLGSNLTRTLMQFWEIDLSNWLKIEEWESKMNKIMNRIVVNTLMYDVK